MKYFFIIIAMLLAAAGIAFAVRFFRIPAKIRKAEEYMETEEYSKASEIIKKILEKKKDNVPARYIRGQLLTRQNQYLMAIAEYNSILAIPGFNKQIKELDVHYRLAQLYSETKNYTKEIEEYKIILTFNADDINANHRIGHAFYRQNDHRRVKDHLMKAVILDPKLIDCYLPLGVSCYKISDYEKAEQYLVKSLEQRGDHTEAEYYLGSIYQMGKNYESAVSMFENARKNRKYLTLSLYSLAEMAFDKNQYGQAIDYLEQGLKQLKEKTDHAYAYRYMLAECYELENKIEEAVYHWKKVAADNANYRSTNLKLESYSEILENNNLMSIFTASLEELQPTIVEIISGLNYNIVSKEKINPNEYKYKAYNIKRINDPPLLIYFNRTTREISEGQIMDFYKKINEEKSKSGIYIATSKFSLRARSSATSKMIELFDSEFVNKVIEKIKSKKAKS
ncbi:MAG: tetratricopeptide repeat protein [bacterium]|nr:tetratricopeptide repeat protein [bacterium]